MNSIFSKLSYLFICGILVLSSSACQKRNLSTSKLKKRSSEYILKQLNQNKKELDWWSAKALISYQDDNQRIKFSSYIRVREDSLIWMNVKKLGVEGARLQLTPDSAYVIDRQNKEYIVQSLGFINRQFDLPNTIGQFMTFDNIINIFYGNPVLLPMQEIKVDRDEINYTLSGEYDDVKSSYQINGNSFELSEVKYTDAYTQNELLLSYSDYRETENQSNFSYFRTIQIENPAIGNMQLKIELSKVEFNVPKTIRFEVPSSYTKVQ